MEVQNANEEVPKSAVAVTPEMFETLQLENKKIREEFDVQRAKMKELFLQKEEELSRSGEEKYRLNAQIKKLNDELDELRSQFVVEGLKLETDLEVEKRKARDEIASLQQLVHETVEESTSVRSVYDSELQKLQQKVQKLEAENQELRLMGQQNLSHVATQESPSLGPSVMLSAVTKTLARKLGADSFSNQENLEESMRRAQEDAEVLRSLVVPLEEEIKALKDKLRATDEQLQKCKLCGHNNESEVQLQKNVTQQSTNLAETQLSTVSCTQPQTDESKDSKSATPPPRCDMCSNYEAELVREQERNRQLETKLLCSEKATERHKEDLLKEIGFRKDIEEKWNEKKEEHKQQVSELNKRTLCVEQDLQELRQTFEQYCSEVLEQLTSLTHERERTNEELIKLQKENDNLVGKYTVHSEQLQSELINLPDTVEELQEKLLRSHEELIIAKVGMEHAQEQEKALQCEMMLLRDQLTMEQQARGSLENELLAEIDLIRSEKQSLEKQLKDVEALKDKFDGLQKSHQSTANSLQQQLTNATLIKKQLEESNGELRSRVASLQKELDDSEAVQQDFVRLSQSLQVQLEKIRASDTQVRWQHDEDVEECPTCRTSFSVTKRKLHCRHCGQIFCNACLGHTVLSGPHQRPSRVCDVCHTLLVKSSAPYFSTEPPHSPD